MSEEFKDMSWISFRLGRAFLVLYFVLALIAGCCEVLSWKKEPNKQELKRNNAIESTDVEIA